MSNVHKNERAGAAAAATPAVAAATAPPRRSAPRWFPILLHCLLLGVLFCLAATPAAYGAGPKKEEILKKKDKIKKIRYEQEQVNRQLQGFRSSERAVLGDVERLTGRVKNIKKRERKLVARKRRYRKVRKTQEKELARLSAGIAEGRVSVTGHLRRIHRLSKTGDSANLLSLARHKGFFKESHYLALLINSDMEAIGKFLQLNKELGKKQKEVKKTIAELAGLGRKLKKERGSLGKNERALRASLEELRKNQQLYGEYLAELEQVKQGMETALVNLEQSAQQNQRSRNRPKPATLRGNLPPPAQGVLVAGFGKQDPRYDLKKFQRGLVIRVAEGAGVRAVASGTAVHAGPFRGYQELVVLEHGHGLFTVYGHLEELQIEKGAWVAEEALLGSATYQPIDSSYNVYFEIRLAGKPQDPIKWLRPGSLKDKTNGAKGP